MLIRPDEIDDRTVPVPADRVALVEVDDSGLLIDEEAGRGFAVNATALLVWKLFDSASPLGDLIDDLTAAFGVPRKEVEDGVLGLARFVGELGMLDNVERGVSARPIQLEYIDVDECGEVAPLQAFPSYDARYVAAPPNA